MRAYFFGNMYLSSIQQGIQAAHVVAEMFTKYDVQTSSMMYERDNLHDWAKDHKTMILLNAGYSEEILSLCRFFDDPENPFPWAPFFEGQDALCGALTCVGIILPEKIYEAAKAVRNIDGSDTMPAWNGHTPSNWEFEMAIRLNNYGMAK